MTKHRIAKRRRSLIAIPPFLLAVGLVAGGIFGASADAAVTAVRVVTDSFNRTLASGLGSAELGGGYTIATGSASAFSVSGGAATVKALSPGQSVRVTMPDVSVADMQITSSFSIPTTGAMVYHSVESRVSSSAAGYRGRIKISADGSAIISVTRFSGSTETVLSTSNLTTSFPAGTGVHLALRVTGSNPVALQLVAWKDGSAVPGWQLTYQDTSSARLSAAGHVGLVDYNSSSSGPVKVLWSDLAVDGLTGATTSTPSSTTTPTTTTTSTTTTSAAPPVSPTVTTGRGSATVGSMSYSIPSGATYVSNSGSDSNAGTVGSPLKTLAKAISATASGGTIVLRGGTYHEWVTIPTSKSNLTIENYPGEAAWLDGSSSVTSWAKSGTRWVASNWNHPFDHSASFSFGSNDSSFLNASYPMAAHPDQVFINGAAQQQVSAASQVVAGTFYVDYTAKTITLGSDPSGKDVRASDLEQGIYSLGANITIRGIGVRRYATPIPRMGSIRIVGNNSTVSNVTAQNSASLGMSFGGANDVADHVTVTNQGILGIHGNHADNFLISNSIVSNSNTEHFNTNPTSSGIKVSRSRTVTVKNNTVSNNLGTGIWMDESVVGATIVSNTVTGQVFAGIQDEIGEAGVIANNTVSGGQIGIYVFDTGNVSIFNNNVTGASVQAIQLSQDQRLNAHPGDAGHDPRYPIPDPTDPWILRNITLSNNIIGDSQYEVWAFDKKTNRAASTMNIKVTGNSFGTPASGHYILAWGNGDNATLAKYTTVTDMLKAGPSWHNVQSSNPAGLSAAAAAGVAVGLPSNVASAIGQPTGVVHLGVF